MTHATRPLIIIPALLVLLASALPAWAQPVLITAPQTVGPEQTMITPTAGGNPVPLATADLTDHNIVLAEFGT